MNKKQLTIILAFIGIIILTAGWYAIGCPPLGEDRCPFYRPLKPATASLTFWSPIDDDAAWREIITRFQSHKLKKENGNLEINISFQKKSSNSYEQQIIDAQLAGNGPDIFAAFHTWVPKYQSQNRIIPFSGMSVLDFKNTYAKVTRDDLIIDGQIYALPMYIDTPALFYNEDMFLNEGFLSPPKTWDEFIDYTEKLTRYDKKGNITRAGAAIGGGTNVNRSVDILSLMLLQKGLAIFNKDGGTDLNSSAAQEVIKFYTGFTDPKKRHYTWNDRLDYSIDMFAVERKAAMMINYTHHIDNIDKKSQGKLDYKIAAVPQFSEKDKVNYAQYWVPLVARKGSCKKDAGVDGSCQQLAWEFLEFAARPENVRLYSEISKKPPAIMSLAQSMSTPEGTGVFAGQVLTARSWHHPNDAHSDRILVNMINSIVATDEEKRVSIPQAASYAASKLGGY